MRSTCRDSTSLRRRDSAWDHASMPNPLRFLAVLWGLVFLRYPVKIPASLWRQRTPPNPQKYAADEPSARCDRAATAETALQRTPRAWGAATYRPATPGGSIALQAPLPIAPRSPRRGYDPSQPAHLAPMTQSPRAVAGRHPKCDTSHPVSDDRSAPDRTGPAQ